MGSLSIEAATDVVQRTAQLATNRARGLSASDTLKYESPTKNEENLVEIIREVLKSEGYDPGLVSHLGGLKFPDIVFQGCGLGVEVKSHESEGRLLGNSIMGGTFALESPSKILLLVWNKSSQTISCHDYFDCVIGAEVTHSPRFVLDINASNEQKMFGNGENAIGPAEKVCLGPNGIDSELILAKMRTLALSKGTVPWWISNPGLGEETPMAVSPSLSLDRYTTLSDIERNILLRTSVVLFPEILSDSPHKYDRSMSWGIASKSVLITRDAYSAGGVVRDRYPVFCPHQDSSLVKVLHNTLQWFKKGASIDASAVRSIFGSTISIPELAEEFKSKLISMKLEAIYKTYVGNATMACQCHEISHDQIRDSLANDLAERILTLKFRTS